MSLRQYCGPLGEGTGTRIRLAVVAAVCALGWAALPATSMAAPTPAVAAPSASLTASWWQTYVAIPASQDPANQCDLGTGQIAFLGATTGGSARRDCTLRAGSSILVPLINVECSQLDPEPFFGQTPAELRACAKGFADQFTDLFLRIDGASVGNLAGLRVQSDPFVFSPVEGNMFGIPAGTGLSVSDGYWALIGPLASGRYNIRFGGSLPAFSFSTEVTYRLNVV
jgi:hypothetical protein